MKLLKGKKISERILKILKNRIKKEKLMPTLAVFLVGEDKASKIYVNLKSKAAEQVGIKFLLLKFKKTEREIKIIQKIEELSKDKKISGIIVQLPLPKKFNTQKIINTIDPTKDVDGFHPESEAAFLAGHENFFPVFPQAILRLLESSNEDLENKKAVILVNSTRFGEVMKAALEKRKIKANYVLLKDLKIPLNPPFAKGEKCSPFSKGRGGEGFLKSADIIISAVGKPGLVKEDMIKNGAIIIDGGIAKKGGKVLGDVDFKSVKDKASFVTPVPGGVGPVTIACLLENVYLAAKKQHYLK